MKIKKWKPYGIVRRSPYYRAGKKLCEYLNQNNFDAYFVGGGLRDLLLRPSRVPKDLDVATSATIEQLKILFPQAQFVGESFGVSMVVFDGFAFEVATFRQDGPYEDKRRPSFITSGTIIEDSCRRDFTINACYFNPLKNRIYDFHDGLKHLKRRMLVCVGDPHLRFSEDALRIIRALRFAANLHFNLEAQTFSKLKEHVSLLSSIAKERFLSEFSKVTNKSRFFQLFLQHIPLAFLFTEPIFLNPREESLKFEFTQFQTKYYSLSLPFFDFLKRASASFFFSVEKVLIELKRWPITRQDVHVCENYLKLFVMESFFQERSVIEEERQFLYFIHLSKLYKDRVKAILSKNQRSLILSILQEQNSDISLNEYYLLWFSQQCLFGDFSEEKNGIQGDVANLQANMMRIKNLLIQFQETTLTLVSQQEIHIVPRQIPQVSFVDSPSLFCIFETRYKK